MSLSRIAKSNVFYVNGPVVVNTRDVLINV